MSIRFVRSRQKEQAQEYILSFPYNVTPGGQVRNEFPGWTPRSGFWLADAPSRRGADHRFLFFCGLPGCAAGEKPLIGPFPTEIPKTVKRPSVVSHVSISLICGMLRSDPTQLLKLRSGRDARHFESGQVRLRQARQPETQGSRRGTLPDRKSTRLNSS